MTFQLTAVFRKVPEGYIGFVEELPGTNTQGDTLAEARANLHESAAVGFPRRTVEISSDPTPAYSLAPLPLTFPASREEWL